MNNEVHSITRHPLREVLEQTEWDELRADVQFCRVSWPIAIEKEEEEE